VLFQLLACLLREHIVTACVEIGPALHIKLEHLDTAAISALEFFSVQISDLLFGSALNLVTGVEWEMKGDSTSCNRTTHNGVPVFDLENRVCFLEAKEALPYCGSSFGYTTATWIDWADDRNGWRSLHVTEAGMRLTAVPAWQEQLGVVGNGGFRWAETSIDRRGWQLVVAIGQDTDCTPDGGLGGTTMFFIGSPSQSPHAVGYSDRSPGSGRGTLYIGDRNHGPGKVAETWAWDYAISPAQVKELWAATHRRYE